MSLPGKGRPDNKQDLRQYPRVMVKLPASIFYNDSEVNGTTVDLSLKGCGIECQNDLPVGAVIKIHLNKPWDSTQVQIDSAIVRYAHGHGFGAEFLQIKPAEQNKLRHLVEWGWGIEVRGT